MAKFRKLQVEIEAFKYGRDNRPDWFCDKVSSNEIITYWQKDRKEHQDTYCLINTLEGQMRGEKGDFIIKGIKGEVYPCKPDIFKATYEAVE